MHTWTAVLEAIHKSVTQELKNPSQSANAEILEPVEEMSLATMSIEKEWLRTKEFACQCRRHGFDPWV